MNTIKQNYLCPVCAYNLDFEPWTKDSPSDEICPSCGIQFGYDDAAGGNHDSRQTIYTKWRERWVSQGMPQKHTDVPDEMQMEIYRNMTDSQKLLVGCKMWESYREIMVSLVRGEHPDWPDEEIRKETSKRMLREALTEKELEALRAD